MNEKLSDVLNEARGDLSISAIHKRLNRARVDVRYNTVFRWFNGEAQPSFKYAGPLFDALCMNDGQRDRAIEAARR